MRFTFHKSLEGVPIKDIESELRTFATLTGWPQDAVIELGLKEPIPPRPTRPNRRYHWTGPIAISVSVQAMTPTGSVCIQPPIYDPVGSPYINMLPYPGMHPDRGLP